MKWRGRQGSSNVEDRRFNSGGGRRGGSGFKLGGGGLIIFAIIYMIMGGNPLSLIPLASNRTQTAPEYVETESDKEKMEFLSVVLKDTEDVWNEVFKDYNLDYETTNLVVFNGSVNSACGTAQAAMGPFYCPLDKKIYMDLDFFDQLKNEFGAKGEFAIAYVLAHEVGHHVQDELGILGEKQQLRKQLSETEYNKISVRIELQADYLAGVFASRIEDKGYLDVDDIDDAIRAAESVGDDILQKRYQGTVVPDAFTHGTADMRSRWFMKGYRAGNFDEFDTFKYEYDDL